MSTSLYLAPAGAGKTAHILERIGRVRSEAWLAPITVILPNQAQVDAFRRRLALGGGMLGVSLGTFYALYPEILAWAGKPEPRLPEPTQYRLLQNIVTDLVRTGYLPYYAPLQNKPGFVVALRALLEELKRAGIRREAFTQALDSLPDKRLGELAALYTAYQDWLLDNNWADTEGQGWLAALALERQPELGRHLRLLIVDGFDEFNPTQLDVLKSLAGRAAEAIITLTGHKSQTGRLALRRFDRALAALSRALDIEPEPLPGPNQSPALAPPLAHLEANLFVSGADSMPGGQALTLMELQNRAEEVRAALRWLKARLVRDNMAPAEVALLARDLVPYRPFIEEVAAEFGLAVYLRQGLKLSANPAIAALLSLLALPVGHWLRRPVLDAWRSPYFEGLAPTPRAADHLAAVARQGRVIQGLEQWQEALQQAVKQAVRRQERDTQAAMADEETAPPGYLSPAEAEALQAAFDAFVTRLAPPTEAPLREYAAWVESLIGDDPLLAASTEEQTGLGMVRRAQAVPATRPRDVAALRTFKDVLRGLLLAESSLAVPGRLTYEQFYQQLHRAVEGTTYRPPPPEPLTAAIPVLSVLDARGLSFRAVALVGLAEGDFPRPEREDILLREEDRQVLNRAGLHTLETRLRGDDLTFFYQAVTRARHKLFLSRPYLAEDGQEWEPSPYWPEVRRLVQAPVHHLRPEDPLPPAEVASPQEAARSGQLGGAEADRLAHSLAVLQARLAPEPQGPYEGDLSALAGLLSEIYGPDHVWSSSRLEAYGLCPHHFWLGQDLALEPRQPPEEGFDIFILGSMYHEILEKVYQQAGAQATEERLLELLPGIAAAVFDQAPESYGFRPTPLWAMQRQELEQILAQTLAALAEATASNTPRYHEKVFGMRDQPPLRVQGQGDRFQVRGFIDRVDQAPDGGLCIIDYKSGSTPIAPSDLAEGRRLQIALYALAAAEALELGRISDGFYWHITSAQASRLQLKKFEGGVGAALETAKKHAFSHIAGVRAGQFPPRPPAAGCPGHCPGLRFCWQYKPKGW